MCHNLILFNPCLVCKYIDAVFFNYNGRRSRQRPHQTVRADQDHISRRKRWRSPSAEIETVLAHFSNHLFGTVADAVYFNHLRRQRSNAYYWVYGLRSGPSNCHRRSLACRQCSCLYLRYAMQKQRVRDVERLTSKSGFKNQKH